MTSGNWWSLFKAPVQELQFAGSVALEGLASSCMSRVLCSSGITGEQHSDGAWCAALSLNIDDSCPLSVAAAP